MQTRCTLVGMRADLGTILICGVPGLAVAALGQLLVWARFFQSRRKSPVGLRLTLAGFGLFDLGLVGGAAVVALVSGVWAVALAVIVIGGWLPILLFWWATRPRVTADSPRQ
jgi:hypothetical protein